MENFLYSLKTKENMHLYYSCKERFSYSLDNRDEFIKKTINTLKPFLEFYNTIIIPESSNSFILEIAKGLNKHIVIVKKREKEKILEQIDSLNLQKKEKTAHLERIKEMGEVFKINSLKSNQRRKYQYLLFEKVFISEPEKSVILDDSNFSGTTLKALVEATGVKNSFFVFSK